MSQEFGKMIAASARLALGYVDRLTADIPAESFGRLARCGDQLIQANHPAFIFGHLALYPSRVVADLGGDATAVSPSQAYNELFSPQAQCLDDPDGTLYPSKDELLAKTHAAYAAA
ncbi:MAG: DinB family protein, partial [Planctomycetota bacterium]